MKNSEEHLPPSVGLISLCQEAEWQPSPQKVRRFVLEGANVFHHVHVPGNDIIETYSGPLLTYLILRGQVEAVDACLVAERNLDFSTQDWLGRTPLHAVCGERISNADTSYMMKSIISRLHEHPGDIVNWNIKTKECYSIFSIAAKYQKLSLVWKIVCMSEVCTINRYTIRLQNVWECDWTKLDEENRNKFHVDKASIKRTDQHTSSLWHAVVCRELEDLDSLRDYLYAGADINCKGPDDDKSILFHLIRYYKFPYIQVALHVARFVDFTVTDKFGDTPLHLAVHHLNMDPEDDVKLLTFLAKRLKSHPKDVVDWNLRNEEQETVLELATKRQKLSVVWNIVRNLPNIGNPKSCIPLPEAWTLDWNNLENHQSRFSVNPSRIIETDVATATLWDRVVRGQLQSVEALRSYLQEGADVNFRRWEGDRSILWHLVKYYEWEYVEEALHFTSYIDFNAIDPHADTPFESACFKLGSKHPEAVKMLTYVMKRMLTHPTDGVDWNERTEGSIGSKETIFSLAAKYQGLSTVWKAFKDVSFESLMRHITKPIPLGKAWAWDLDALEQSDRKFFTVQDSNIIDADMHTARLWDCVVHCRLQSVDELQSYIDAGADVNFRRWEGDKSILWHLIRHYESEFLEVALRHAVRIDFSLSDSYGDTVMHYLCYPMCGDPLEKLQLILQRMESHDNEMIHWPQRNEEGDDFISHVAFEGKLFLFWPYLKKVPFFASQRDVGIPLISGAVRQDWERLSGEDQQFFIVPEILEGDPLRLTDIRDGGEGSTSGDDDTEEEIGWYTSSANNIQYDEVETLDSQKMRGGQKIGSIMVNALPLVREIEPKDARAPHPQQSRWIAKQDDASLPSLVARDVFASEEHDGRPYYLAESGNRIYVVDTRRIRYDDNNNNNNPPAAQGHHSPRNGRRYYVSRFA